MTDLFFRSNDAGGGAGNVLFQTNSTGTTTPSVLTVNSTTPVRGSTLVISMLNAGGAAGTVTLGGVAQTVLGWSDSTVSIAVVRGTNKYGVPLNLVVTRADAVAASPFALFSLQPQAGWQFVNIVTPNPTVANRITAVADIAAGNQLAWGNITGTGPVTVANDATWSALGTVTGFDAELWTTADGWGTAGTQNLVPVVPVAYITPVIYQPNAPSAAMPNTAGVMYQLRASKSATTILYAAVDGVISAGKLTAPVPNGVGTVGDTLWLDAYWTQTIGAFTLRLNASGAITLQAAP